MPKLLSATLLFCLGLAFAQSEEDCSHFLVNGSHAYFSYYRFYDFRNLTPGYPPGGRHERINMPKSLIVNDTEFSSDWTPRRQDKQPPSDDAIGMRYLANYVAIGKEGETPNSSFLEMWTKRENETSQAADELDFTQTNMTYGSFRVMARLSGEPGAVGGIFTYHNDTQETDIELLTRDPPHYAHFANQPTTDDSENPIKGAGFNVSAANYSDWSVYRFDWLPDETIWYVNGKELARTNVQVPTESSMFIINLWSNSGKFSGDMRDQGEAKMHVQWVEMAFNRLAADSVEKPKDGQVCSLDKVVGEPVPGLSVRLASGRRLLPLVLAMAVSSISSLYQIVELSSGLWRESSFEAYNT